MKPIKMSNQYNKTFIDIRLIDDLKKFKGLPPYDGFNTLLNDNWFWNDITRRFSMDEIKEAEKEIKHELVTYKSKK